MDELVRTKMHEALEVEQPDGGLRGRVLSSLPVDDAPGRRWRMPAFQWAGGFVAVLLTVAVVAGLLYFRVGSGQRDSANTGPMGQVAVSTQVGFKCQLPIVAYASTFAQVQLPAGTVVNETRAPVPSNGTAGKGAYGPAAYDIQARRWLPVTQRWISPDGKSYAYGTQTTGVPGQGPTGTIHIVDVATGKDRQVWTGDGAPQVMSFLAGGIYFMKSGLGSPAQDLWVVDPANPAAAHRIGPNPPPPPPGPSNPFYGPSSFFSLVGAAGAFGTGFAPRTEPPGPTTGPLVADRLLRMDLATGAVSTWWVNPTGGGINLMGLDAQGRPVVGASNQPPPAPGPNGPVKGSYVYSPSRVLILTGPNQFTEVAPGTDPAFMASAVSGDSHGLWFSVPGSIWLYDSAGGLRKVFSVPDGLFPGPTPPPGFKTPPGGIPTPPPGLPTGTFLQVVGPCT